MSIMVIVLLFSDFSKSYGRELSMFHLGDSAENFGDFSRLHDNDEKRVKYIDVYTNYPDQEEVESTFYQNYNIPKKILKNVNPDLLLDREDTLTFNIFPPSKLDKLESEFGQFVSESSYMSKPTHSNRNSKYYENRFQDTSIIPQNNYDRQKDKDGAQLIIDKDRDNYVFLQSQIDIPDSENDGSFYPTSDFSMDNDYRQSTRPRLSTKKANITRLQSLEEGEQFEGVTMGGYSYVQKIPLIKRGSTTTISPKMPNDDPNRYEEIDLSEHSKAQDKTFKVSNTRKRINDLLKKYLVQVFVEKYADKKIDQEEALIDSNGALGNTDFSTRNSSNRPTAPKTVQESKFLTSDTFWALKNKTISKIKTLFSIFTVIKFNNTECNATTWAGTWQGVCYTSTECSQLNGTSLGNCANGYGVCCVFRGSCGDSSNRNCSYFKSPNYPDYYPSTGGVITPTTTAAPSLTTVPTPDPRLYLGQVRRWVESDKKFYGGVITPTTTAAPSLTTVPTPDPRLHWYYYNRRTGDEELDNIIQGRQSSSDTLSCIFSVYKTNPEVKQMRIDFIDLDLAGPTNGTCTNERLVIRGQNANDQIPVICGYNTGMQVYVDVSQLTGPLQLMILSTTGQRKRFKLRICQYTDSCGTPQSNCLQYYTGVSGIIQSFNYDQAAMFNRSSPGYFNNLNYAICIRREAGYCSVTYTNVRNGQTFPFQLVNRLPNGQLIVPAGQAGVDILNCPDDYIIIDGTRLCGDRFNDGSTVFNFNMNAPVVDTSAGPIVINIRTNNNVTGLGFKLYYTQNPCTAA